MFYFQNICIAIINTASIKQLSVLGVNILSLKKKYVMSANVTLETPKPTSFEVQYSPEYKYIYFTACQKHRPVGTASNKLVKSGLSFQ